MIHVVLYSPKIPNNTGSIIRLCANTGAALHLIEPLGFDMEDTKLRRAGLDYHEFAKVLVHADWAACKETLIQQGVGHMVALTTKFSQPFFSVDFAQKDGDGSVALIFGSETDGLPEMVRADIGAQNWLRLPMLPSSRSMNLSNAVAVCLYEVWRQQGFLGDVGQSVNYYQPTSLAPQ